MARTPKNLGPAGLTSTYKPTHDNLRTHAVDPMMGRLIATALDRDTVTYGELKTILETQAGFSTIFSKEIGPAVGILMERLQRTDANAPLINVLVVTQKDRLPSDGAGPFMAKRFRASRLNEEHARARFPDLWRRNFNRAAAEVYARSPQQWAELYRKTFDRELSVSGIDAARRNLQGSEKDGLQYNARRGGPGGEGPEHKALREWVTANPARLHRGFAGARTATEVDLPSGDRVDVVYDLEDRTIVIEVKSRMSDEADLRRGVYQCVKYRAVRKAMDVRKEDAPVEACLVTETKVSGEIGGLLKVLNIRHVIVPQDRS